MFLQSLHNYGNDNHGKDCLEYEDNLMHCIFNLIGRSLKHWFGSEESNEHSFLEFNMNFKC